MNLCIVTETFWPELNGVANTLHHIVKGLSRMNCKVQLICPAHAERSHDTFAANFNDNVEYYACKSMPLPGYAEVNVGFPSKKILQRAWRKRRPDAIYVATEGPLGWQAVKLANAMGLQVVSGFHTNFQSYSRYYGLKLLEGLVKRYLVSIHNKTSNTIVPSADQAAMVKGMGVKDVAIMGRGVDTALYSPKQRNIELRKSWGASDNDTVLLYVGRLAQEKNLDLAIKTYRQLKLIDNSLHLVLVGDGPMMSQLKQAHPDLVFTGAKQGLDLAQCYASADIFIFPSLTETFGNVVLEAMASGLGVVAFDYAAAKQHIDNKLNGIRVAFANENAFIEATQSLSSNDLLLRKIRGNAADHALAYSWDAIVRRFIELLGLGSEMDIDGEFVYADLLA